MFKMFNRYLMLKYVVKIFLFYLNNNFLHEPCNNKILKEIFYHFKRLETFYDRLQPNCNVFLNLFGAFNENFLNQKQEYLLYEA